MKTSERANYHKKYWEDNKERIKLYRASRRDSHLAYMKEWRQKHPTYATDYNKKYREDNLEKVRQKENEYSQNHKEERRSYNKEYYQTNKKAMNDYKRKWKNSKYHSSPQAKLKELLRCRLNLAIKNGYRGGSAVRDLGCTIPELIEYIEVQFQQGMSWNNWGLYGWHIDHIEPLANFDLTNRKQLLKAVHYTNLQPLWAVDNFAKNRYIKAQRPV